MQLSDFDYYLPPELIASKPLAQRSDSRLLVAADSLIDTQFSHIIDYINPNDLLILNNSKVIKARLFGHKLSGGKIEVMLERIRDKLTIIAHLRTSKSIKIGLEILLPAELQLVVTNRLDGGLFELTAAQETEWFDYLDRYGNLPLPPYMQRPATATDSERYQTVFAMHQGSVAAPTAGLHFTQQLLEQLQAKGSHLAYVTLHIGSGTFKPVSSNDIKQHKMHSEIYSITQATIDKIKQTRLNNGKIIAVGTTSLRTLETVAQTGLIAQAGETDIFITPGYNFQLVDKLITNFHLPRSTLLMLVNAFAGKETITTAYNHAISNNYRFFSYGDAMLLNRKDN